MNDDRTREGLAHLQAAALEAIAAIRAFLDVAEDLVREPGAAAAVVQAASAMARAARRTGDRTQEGEGDRAAGDEESSPGVTRIRLS